MASVGRLSMIVERRSIAVTAACAALLVAAVGAAFMFGVPTIPPLRAFEVLTGGGAMPDRIIMLDLRANRTIVAALAGSTLGLAGALMQTVTRNPLASPDILGVTGGASVGAVAVIVVNGGPAVAPWAVPVGALIGGAVIAGVMALVAAGLDPLRLVLSGIALAALCSAAITFLLSYIDGDVAHTAMSWLAGTLNGRGPQHIWPVLIGLVLCGGVLIPLTRSIGLLPLGDAKAATMGVDTLRTERTLLFLSVVLASLATAATGPIGFVAFVAPQIVRSIARRPAPPLVASALAGAIIVVVADTAARAAIPWTTPIGAVTSAFGAPLLIYYMWRSTRV
ncbi:iron ABC transporter permease [Gordonia malaquae]|uniref:FecCD family ABC transporter permease n=2 Tax=Gordonia malaquae TaxID=410332 RepID=UPI0030C79911